MDDAELNEDEIADVKRLLALGEIVDKYPQVITRRITGITYVLIGGAISFATLVMFVLTVVYQPLPWNPLINLLFVGVSLLITWIIAFRLIGPLTKSMPKKPPDREPPKWYLVMWAFIAIILTIGSVFLFTQENPVGFPILVQCVLALGQAVPFLASRKDPDGSDFGKESFAFAIAALLSIPLMLLVPELAYLLIIVVDIGGIFILGVYALVTAEQLLLETTGRG
jgi:hypothetical protein